MKTKLQHVFMFVALCLLFISTATATNINSVFRGNIDIGNKAYEFTTKLAFPYDKLESNTYIPLQIISDSKANCKDKDHAGQGSSPDQPGRGECLSACDSSTVKYFTVANPGSTYQWFVGGAISFTPSANQVIVNWGSAGSGFVKVIETRSDSTVDSLKQCVTIILSPKAKFTASPGIVGGIINVCLNQPVNFMDMSVDAATWYWDFGDGNYFSGQNPPPHKYTASGTYTVTLTVTNKCNCKSTKVVKVVVDKLPGPDIECPSVVCSGDTAVYSTSAVCGTYNWSVTGGTIVSSPANSNTIVVAWGNGNSGPGTVTLDITGCAGFCTVPTTVLVPIIPKNGIITGNITVCLYSTENYQVPLIPGTNYNWTLTPGGIIQTGQGTNQISVYWDTPGTHVVDVDYYNKFVDCGGKAQLKVKVLPSLSVYGPNQLCANSVNTLNPFNAYSASGPVNVNWSVVTPSATTLSNLQTNSSVFNTYNWNAGPGTYTIIAVASPGTFCNDTFKTTVNVINPPAAPTAQGDTIICGGGTYQYTATSALSPVTFTWSIIGGTMVPANGIGNPVSVTWNTTGPYGLSVVQELVNVPGCPSAPYILNINTKPAPVITGPPSSCVNGTSTFTATLQPGLTYNWVLSPANLGSIVSGNGTNSILVQWLNATGTASLSISYPECPSLSSTLTNISLTNAAPPSITLSGPLCVGSSINLLSASATSYIWTDQNNVVFGGNNQSVSINAPGNYNLTVTYANGCISTNAISVSQSPSPTASISAPFVLTYCGTATVPNITFYALTGSGYTFQWLQNGSPISGATNPTYTTNVVGNYSVVVTLGSCSKTSNVLSIVYNPTCGTGCSTTQTVNFANPGAVCNPVTFSGSKSGGIGSHWWNFDDPASGANNTAGSMTPTHVFTHAGYFNVTFTGTGISTNPPDSCTTQRIRYVKIPLVPKFESKNTCLSDTVFFTDLSTTTPGDNITSWSWNFGDPGSGAANTSTLQNPKHKFSTSGPHTVILTVTNPLCTLSFTATITIVDVNPTFTAIPSPTCVNTPITFSGSAGSPILNWNWNFGDTTTSVLQVVPKSFSYAGPHTITLNVTDTRGCKGTVSQSINILPPPTPGVITASGPTTFCQGDSLVLTAPAGTSYVWSTNATTQSIVVHTAGNYFVKVTNANGCTYTTVNIAIQVTPSPIAEIKGNLVICEGQVIGLTATYGSYTYQWFYNNSPIPAATNYFYYDYSAALTEAGAYSVLITDTATGCSSIASVNVVVNPVPITPVIAANVTGPYCSGHLVTISITNFDPTLTYLWNTGSQATSFSTAVQGNYVVTVMNQYGCKSQSNNVFIAPSPKIEEVISGCYEFCDSVKPKLIPGPAGYTSYVWQQFDPNTNSFQTIGNTQNITTSISGTYQLILTNAYGCVDTSALLDIAFKPCEKCEELSITYTSTSQDTSSECCYKIGIQNFASGNTYSALQINSLNGVNLNYTVNDPNWIIQNFSSNSLTLLPASGFIPLGANNNLLNICLSGQTETVQEVVFSWFGTGPKYPVLCTDTLKFYCKPDKYCVTIFKDSLYCDGDSLVYTFYIKNNNPSTIQSIQLMTDSLQVINTSPHPIVFPPLLAGQTYGPITVGMSWDGLVPGELFCFTITAFDSKTEEMEKFCCNDQIKHCVIVPPLCDPCDSLNVSVKGNKLDCCWDLTLTNHASLNIYGVQTQIISGSGFTSVNNPLGSGWNLNYLSNTNLIWTTSNGGPLPTQTVLPKFCFGNNNTTNQVVAVNWLVAGQGKDSVLCADTVVLNCLSDCIGLFDGKILCTADGQYVYTFSVYNNFHLPFQQFEFEDIATNATFVTYPVFTGNIPVGGIATYTIAINGNPGDKICFRIEAYDKVINNEHFNCCLTDSVYCITLPVCDPTSQDPGVITTKSGVMDGLLNIYPNPMKDKVNVVFIVPVDGDAEFDIVNTNGNLVSIPFKGKVEANKQYSFEFDASILSGGLFIGQLKTSSGYILYKKLVVIK